MKNKTLVDGLACLYEALEQDEDKLSQQELEGIKRASETIERMLGRNRYMDFIHGEVE